MSLTVRYHWTSPLREALAKSVEKREKLWKKFPVVSHDIDLRAKLWAEVADELMEQFGILIDTEDMKKTWKNLKDNYWRIIKSFDTEPERAMRWKFYEAMRFMERANSDEPQSSRSPSFDPHNVPSSSDTAPEHVRTAEDLSSETNMKNNDPPPPGQLAFNDMPLQLKGISGNSRRNRTRRAGSSKSQAFMQISIPELDRLITTKQRPQFGSHIQCMPVDLTEDNLASDMEPVFQLLEEEARAKLKAEREMRAALNNKEQATEWVRKTMPEIERPEEQLRITTDPDNKFADLIKMSRFNYELTDEARTMIANRASRLRGIYHQGAFAFFVKQDMPKGQLQKLLDAFDDFVYNKKPRDPVVSKVVEICDPSMHTAFVALFSIIERYGEELKMRCPDNRWAQKDKECKIDAVDKRRKVYDIAELEEAEHQRLINTRAILAKKIKEYTDAVNSTEDLLSMLDYDDLETRVELSDTLLRTQYILEKITKEQRDLEVEFREFESKRLKRQKRKGAQKRKKGSDTALDPEEVVTPIAATDLLQNVKKTTPNVTELFDNTVKKEPQ